MNNSDSVSTPTPTPKSRKLHRRYTPFVFAFFMSAIMALFMCSVIVAIQSGFHAGYWGDVMKAYTLAMPVAFFCVMGVRPLVMWLVERVVDL